MTQITMYPAQPTSPDFTLTNDITDSQTDIEFDDLTGLLAAPNTLTIRTGDVPADTTPETVYYATGPTGNVLTVTRGYGGTTAKAFSAGALACRAHTAFDHNTFRSNILDLDSSVFHKATSGEINALSVKGSPIGTDILMIEDSADTFSKAKVSISALPFVSSIAAGEGMNFVTITTNGTITLGTPGSVTSTSTNAVAAGTHTHAIDSTIFTAANGKSVTTPIVDGTAAIGSTNTWADGGHIHPTDTSRAAEPLVLGTPTLTTLQDFLNGTGSGGRIYGGQIADAGGGLIDISALKGFIVTADYTLGSDAPATIRFFDLDAQSGWGGSGVGTTLTTDATNYIYVDYNSGTPIVKCTTDRSTIRETDQFTLGRVFKIDASNIEIMQSGINLYDRVRLTHEKWIDTFGGLSYANGMVVSTTTGSGGVSPYLGPRPAFTAGTFYAGSNKISVSAVDCNAGGTFTEYYYNPTAAAWVKVTGQTQLDNQNYNNTSSGTGLSALTTNRYGVHWLYICPQGSMYILLGQGDYTLAQAQAAAVPSTIPNYISQWCKLAAKIIVQKSSTTAYQIVSAWTTAFPVTQPTDHNDLAGLQGGTSDQYYHLTLTDYTGNGTGTVVRTASPALTGTPTAPSAAVGTDSTQIATTEFVQDELLDRATVTTSTMSVYVDKAATGAGDGTSWTDAFTTIQAAVDSIPDIIGHNISIYIRKGSTPYAENIIVDKILINNASFSLYGEYYWSGECAAAATPSDVKFNVTATDGANIAAGDIVCIQDGYLDYIYTTVVGTVDKGSNVWEVEITDALPTGNIGSGDYYRIIKTIISNTGCILTAKCAVNCYGLRMQSTSLYATLLYENGNYFDTCSIEGYSGQAALRSIGVGGFAARRCYLYSTTVGRPASGYGTGNHGIGQTAAIGAEAGCVIASGGNSAAGFLLQRGVGNIYGSIINVLAGTAIVCDNGYMSAVGTTTISPSGRTAAAVGLNAINNGVIIKATNLVNNATTPEDPASSSDGAYIH